MPEVQHLTTYVGPNLYASDPVAVFSLSASPDDVRAAPHRIARVAAASASWFTWSAADAAPADTIAVGRFLVTWAGAVQNEFGASLAVAAAHQEENGEVRLVLGCYDDRAAALALNLAAKVFTEIDKLSPADFEKLLEDFRNAAKRYQPDFQAQYLINAARKRDIPFQRFVANSQYWQYGWGAKSEKFFESSPAEDSAMGKTWCRDKLSCKQVFTLLGVPVAPSARVRNESELGGALRKVGFPCVTKPSDRGQALGVTTHVRDWEGLVQGYLTALEFTRAPVIVEAFVEGEAYRILLVRGKLWRVIVRQRPFVVGDGHSTIQALAEALYIEGMKGFTPGRFRKPAPLDDVFRATLREQNFGPDDVPPAGMRIRLRNLPNLPKGATHFDVTDAIHPDVRLMSETIAQTFGIQVCGLDYMTEDISKSCFGHGVFLEANPTPGLRTPWAAGVDADEIGRVILGERPGRIPLVFVIASDADYARVDGKLPRDHGVGWICGPRAGIGRTEFPDRHPSYHPHLAKIVRNSIVEAVIIVCDIQQIAAQGMPARRADLTIFLGAELTQHSAWGKVLKEHSGRTAHIETSAIDRLPDLIAAALPERASGADPSR